MTFDELNFEPRVGLGGIQAVHFFDNNYGASVIRGPGTYGNAQGLYELAVLKKEPDQDNWDICYTTPITGDVIGYLSEDEVTSTLKEIEGLQTVTEITTYDHAG